MILMIPWALRIKLIAVAILFMVIVFRAVNKKRLQMKYSVIWVIISAGMISVAFFPQIVSVLIVLLGIETPANFVYLVGLLAAMTLCFSLTITVSKQSEEIKRLTQEISIEKHKRENENIEKIPE